MPDSSNYIERLHDSWFYQNNQKSYSEFENKPDKEIWGMFKSGSEVALIYIYNKYFKTLYNYGSQFTRDRFLIKDAIQDLFIELLNKRNKISDTNSIKYYLFKSIKINLINKFKNQKIDYKNDTSGFDFGLSVSIEEKLINAQMDNEKRRKLQSALEKLKKKQREVIYYYYFEDLDFSQIASLMHFTNAKSAQNLLYRALKKLKESFVQTIGLISIAILTLLI